MIIHVSCMYVLYVCMCCASDHVSCAVKHYTTVYHYTTHCTTPCHCVPLSYHTTVPYHYLTTPHHYVPLFYHTIVYHYLTTLLHHWTTIPYHCVLTTELPRHTIVYIPVLLSYHTTVPLTAGTVRDLRLWPETESEFEKVC